MQYNTSVAPEISSKACCASGETFINSKLLEVNTPSNLFKCSSLTEHSLFNLGGQAALKPRFDHCLSCQWRIVRNQVTSIPDYDMSQPAPHPPVAQDSTYLLLGSLHNATFDLGKQQY